MGLHKEKEKKKWKTYQRKNTKGYESKMRIVVRCICYSVFCIILFDKIVFLCLVDVANILLVNHMNLYESSFNKV